MPRLAEKGPERRGGLPVYRDHGLSRRLCQRRRPSLSSRVYIRNTVDIRGLRAKVLYDSDEANTIRKSHENTAIKELYATYLGEPGSEKAHHLLHTSYVKRSINQH